MSDRERESREFYTDKTGRNVVRGDFIAYGHNLGRCAGIRFGKVLDIYTVKEYGREEWRITVRGVDDDWEHNEPKLTSRNGVLMYPDRTLKVNDLIPDDYRELLMTI